MDGLTTEFTYDAAGQILSQAEIDTTGLASGGTSRTITYQWSTAGRLLEINGPRPVNGDGRDDVTTFTYDAQGNRLTMTNALGHVTSYANYNANGNPGEMTDPNGIKTVFTYDFLGHVKTIIVKHPSDPAKDALTALDYDEDGRVVDLALPDTAKLTFDYDLADRLLSMRSDDGERIDYTYDAMNNVLSETVRRTDGSQSRGITRTFDELGRMLTEVLGPGRTTAWKYDKNGNPTKITSPRGNETVQAFDALDRLVRVTAPDTGITRTAYNTRDEVTRFTDAKEVVTRFVRNGFGEVVREISPDRGTTHFTYNEGGDLASITDGRGQRVNYTHDILGRITRKVPAGHPEEAVNYDWDQPDTETTYRIDRLTRIRDATGTTVFNYDHRGNLMSQRQKLLGTTDWVWLRYAYDLANRITLITYPSGRQVQYVRDDKGRVRTVKTRANNTVTSWTVLASAMSYEPFGSLKSMNLGNGLKVANDWGSDGRLASRRLYRASGGTNLSLLSYGYDADDNITSITDAVDGSRSQGFGYDVAGRLSRLDTASGAIRRTDYVYDVNGNRLSGDRRALPDDAQPLETDSYAYIDGTNQLASVATPAGIRSIAYDSRGNTASESRADGVSVATGYDGYGRLTAYNRSNTDALGFVYNGRDDRVAMTAGSATRRFVYDPDGRVMGEYGNSVLDVKAEFVWLASEAANDPSGGGRRRPPELIFFF